MKIVVICAIILLMHVPRGSVHCQTNTLEVDSLNLCVLRVNTEDYSFEDGFFIHYSKCTSCTNDSIPFEIDFEYPGDFGSILFSIESTSDTAFFADVNWFGGIANTYFPPYFSSLAPFNTTSNHVPKPTDIEYYTYNGNKTSDVIFTSSADSAWRAIDSLYITNLFANYNFKAAIFRYQTNVGMPDYDQLNKWIVFLYFNDISSEMNTSVNSILVDFYPNPASTFLKISSFQTLQIEITNVNGQTLKRANHLNGATTIDIHELPAGFYFLKARSEREITCYKFLVL